MMDGLGNLLFLDRGVVRDCLWGWGLLFMYVLCMGLNIRERFDRW